MTGSYATSIDSVDLRRLLADSTASSALPRQHCLVSTDYGKSFWGGATLYSRKVEHATVT